MPYSKSITFIDELPPMVQLPQNYVQTEENVSQKNIYTNPYYEEIIKEHPTVQSKIRPTEVNPHLKYEETFPQNAQQPAHVSQNYIRGNMIPQEEVQYLPIAKNIPTQYDRTFMKDSMEHSNYPIVESFGTCKDLLDHIGTCPLCSKLYSKNERLYYIIGSVLIIIILILLFKIKNI